MLAGADAGEWFCDCGALNDEISGDYCGACGAECSVSWVGIRAGECWVSHNTHSADGRYLKLRFTSDPSRAARWADPVFAINSEVWRHWPAVVAATIEYF